MVDALLNELLVACSPPGNEHAVREILVRELKAYGSIHKTRWTGFYMTLEGARPGRLDVVLTAHMDSPGFTVRAIDDDGKLDVIHLGGIDPHRVNPRLVQLRTVQGQYVGVLQLEGEAQGKLSAYKGFFGFKDKADAEAKGVRKGDPLSWQADAHVLANDYIVAPQCDNRVGCYLLCEVAKRLHELRQSLDVNVHFAATGCEEVGGRGARIMGQMIKPSLALCFDTTYEEGDVKMGQGTTVTLSDASVILPTNIRDALMDLAKAEDIPLQFEVYNYAGTDASGFRDVGSGCLTLCPLVPSLHNHSAHEIVSLKDVDATASLAVAVVKKAADFKVV